MQQQRTDDASPSLGTVHGLGIADALRLTLEPTQVWWLIDELEEMRGPLEERLTRLHSDGCAATSDAVRAAEYDLKLVRMMRAQLSPDPCGPVQFTGPGAMVVELVRSTMRNAAESLAEVAGADLAYDEAPRQRLRDTAEAARAWVETFLDCQAVVGFNFDPECDPPTGV